MNIEAKVIRIGSVQSVGANNFKKREIVVETDINSAYPQTIQLEAQGEKVGIFDTISPGDIVDFQINLKGREWTDPKTGDVKVFNTLTVWKVDKKGVSASVAPQTEPKQPNPDGGDVPF